MVFGMENGLALVAENEGGNGVVTSELVDDGRKPPNVSKSGGYYNVVSTFILIHECQIIYFPQDHFKCMIKIPPSLGDQNINLTMEYLQEEEDPTLDKVEEEEGNSSFTSFRFI